jgi:hypothetical protein
MGEARRQDHDGEHPQEVAQRRGIGEGMGPVRSEEAAAIGAQILDGLLLSPSIFLGFYPMMNPWARQGAITLPQLQIDFGHVDKFFPYGLIKRDSCLLQEQLPDFLTDDIRITFEVGCPFSGHVL